MFRRKKLLSFHFQLESCQGWKPSLLRAPGVSCLSWYHLLIKVYTRNTPFSTLLSSLVFLFNSTHSHSSQRCHSNDKSLSLFTGALFSFALSVELLAAALSTAFYPNIFPVIISTTHNPGSVYFIMAGLTLVPIFLLRSELTDVIYININYTSLSI